MIAKLRGLIDSFGKDHVILDVNGVGYMVFLPARIMGALGRPGETARLLIETHVREDAFQLYGFQEESERAWFRLLTSVQGVGMKHAMAMLGVLSPEQLQVAVAAEDTAMLARAEGVGKKLAGRIVAELQDKVGTLGEKQSASATPDPAVFPTPGPSSSLFDEGVSALTHLGYGRSEAFAAVSRVLAREDAPETVETLIPQSLKELSAA